MDKLGLVLEEKSAQDAAGADLEQTESSAPDSLGASAPTTRLYRRRWLMLLLFSAVSLSNSYQWIQYGIISDIIMKFYMVEAVAVDMIAMIYMIVYVLLVVPGSWLLGKKGLRVTLLWASVFNCAGAWIKVASAKPDWYWVTALGQCLCAVAQVLTLGVPSLMAAVWFGENEVSSACSIGVFGNLVSWFSQATFSADLPRPRVKTVLQAWLAGLLLCLFFNMDISGWMHPRNFISPFKCFFPFRLAAPDRWGPGATAWDFCDTGGLGGDAWLKPFSHKQ